jgi:hypothetical protein
MLTNIVPLAVGNALKVFIAPPATAVLWRVLRTVLSSFVDENDPHAVVVFQGNQDTFLIDATGLANGTHYTYGAFYFDGSAWAASPVMGATPNATYDDQTVDALTVVRDRIEVGLQVEVARGVLTPQNGVIEVKNAPPAIEDTRWPVVTIQVVSDGSGDRALGESISLDEFDPLSDQYEESEGWIARVHLSIIGWSKNPDERITLRKVLRRLVIANLPVFNAAGLVLPDFNQTDVNEMSTTPPIYASEGTFTCMAPAVVRSSANPITDVSVSIDTTFPSPA